jgi:adenine-specific DNA-methyltransferase
MDEVFGEDNFIALIAVNKTSGLQSGTSLPHILDFVLQYSRRAGDVKFRPLFVDKRAETDSVSEYFYVQSADLSIRTLRADEREGIAPLPEGIQPFRLSDLTKPGPGRKFEFVFNGVTYSPGSRWWGNPEESLRRVGKANRLFARKRDVCFVRFLSDFSVRPINNYWRDVAFTSRSEDKTYIVQTAAKVIERCVLMATDPGDLVLDPTCGSGTTAYVAEQWGRRWITVDTSRVALALARARIMGARYPFYLLADSRDGQMKEAEITRIVPSSQPVHNNIRHGFVYERVPHITLKSIANNAEIDVIWEK